MQRPGASDPRRGIGWSLSRRTQRSASTKAPSRESARESCSAAVEARVAFLAQGPFINRRAVQCLRRFDGLVAFLLALLYRGEHEVEAVLPRVLAQLPTQQPPQADGLRPSSRNPTTTRFAHATSACRERVSSGRTPNPPDPRPTDGPAGPV